MENKIESLRHRLAMAEDRSTRADSTEAYLADMATIDKLQKEIEELESEKPKGDITESRLSAYSAHTILNWRG